MDLSTGNIKYNKNAFNSPYHRVNINQINFVVSQEVIKFRGTFIAI
jgi:hypothetical protein